MNLQSMFLLLLLIFITCIVSAGIVDAQDINLTFEGHFGGEIYTSAVSGNYAYIGQGQDFVVLDVSNPASPVQLGKVSTGGLLYDIKVSGSYAFVADYETGLVILDISDPTAPLYAGNYDTAGHARGVTVSGSYAYVTDYYNGLVILDISDPTAPSLAGSYDTAGIAYDVTVSGSHAYVADANGLVILDISDPTAPSLAGSYDTAGTAYEVTVSGSHAHVADGSNGLVILNISDPTAPSLAGSCDTIGLALGVTVSGSHAYVADGGNGLVILDISDSTAPSLAGSYDTADIANRVTISGSHAYVADSETGLVILDISDPIAPSLAGSYDTGNANWVTISGSHAYVTDGGNGLVILDISDPTAPSLAGSYDTAGYAYEVTVSGSHAYVADGGNGLVILDISDPTAPSLAGSYVTGWNALGVTVNGSHAYVADGGNGLVILDISDPTAPSLAGSCDIAGDAYDITVSGSYAYVVVYETRLVILDISDPTAPSLVSSYDTAGFERGITVSGSHAYVADAYGLVILDISDPTAPSLAGSYDTADIADRVTISGSHAYVADFLNGLVILDISDPTAPSLAGNYDTAGWATGITVSGSHVYVADYLNGLVILAIDASSTSGPVHNINKGTDYTTIQAAIDNASPGDEIHVDSGTYYENVNVTKQLILRCIDTGAGIPVVDAGGIGNGIILSADGIVLDGFVTTNAGSDLYAGIKVISSYNTLSSNTASNNSNYGISLTSSSHNTLSSNTASNNIYGISLSSSSNNNTLTDNNVNNNIHGINLFFSNNNSLIGNNASNNVGGIILTSSSKNKFSGNTVYNNNYGIYAVNFFIYPKTYPSISNTFIGNMVYNNSFGIYLLSSSENNTFYQNNLINNTNSNAYDNNSQNQWNSGIIGNHYSDYTGTDSDGDGIGDTPYPIQGDSSVDRYPLMTAYSPPTSDYEGKLLRQTGDFKVYLIEDDKKRHFTSSEALEWNGHIFHDVIEVSQEILDSFELGADINITEVIINKYNDLGGEATFGTPAGTGEQSGYSDSSGVVCSYVNFQNGAIEYFTNGDQAGNAYAILNPFFDKWASIGYGKSVLGYPISDMSDTQTSSCGTPFKYQNFMNGTESGALEYNLSSGEVFEIHGAIYATWSAMGHADSILGLVTSDERETVPSFKSTTGRVSDFENGHLHWHSSGDHYMVTYMTYDDLDELYVSMGGTASWLGFPVMHQEERVGYGYCEFEGGRIEWDDSTGAYKIVRSASPAGICAYVTDANSNTVSVIDTATNTVTATVLVEKYPQGVAVTPDGKKVYVTHPASDNVSVINTATNEVTKTVPVGHFPWGVAVNPAGTKVYVTNVNSKDISVINIATDTVTTTVPVESHPKGIAFNPDEKNIFVINNEGTLSVIDTATNEVIKTVPVGLYPNAIAVTPDGKKVYVTNQDSGNVSVIDTATTTVIVSVPVGSDAYGVAVTPNGKKIYVASAGNNTVYVINRDTNTVTATVPVGEWPCGVAVNPAGTKIYVVNWGSGNVSVIDTATNRVISTVNVGINPWGVAVSSTIEPVINEYLVQTESSTEVYLIENGIKHHFTSPEALEWNGYSFSDVIEVSSETLASIPDGADINISQAIIDKYHALGGSTTFGQPVGTGEQSGYPDNAGVICTYVNFQNGAIEYFTNGDQAGNTYAILNPFFDKWASMGYGKSVLGYPISDMSDTQTSSFGTSFKYQNFMNGTESGSLEYNLTSGEVFEIHGAIYATWSAMGYANSILGLVTSDERDAVPSFKGTTGRVSDFENGHLHWHSSGDHYMVTYMTYGDLDELYVSIGGTASWLGFPVMDQEERDGYGYCEFECGYIEWDASSGTYVAKKFGITDGLVAEWHFDEGTGNVLGDSSGNGNDGTIYGATWTTNGKFDSALQFDGNDYIVIPDSPELSGGAGKNLTVEYWFNTNNQGAYIISKIRDVSYKDWSALIGGFGPGLNFWYENRGYDRRFFSGSTIEEGMWHHGAFTFQRSTSGSNAVLKMYLDGNELPLTPFYQDSVPSNQLYDMPDTSAPVSIGYAGTYYGNLYFNGKIDEIRVFDRVLTAEDIKSEFDRGGADNQIVISELLPEHDSHIGSTSVQFSWRTNLESSSDLFIKQQDETSYSHYTGNAGTFHSIGADNLLRNTWYDFYVSSGSKESEVRNIFIDNGIEFTQKSYNFNIERDYSQQATVTVQNTDTEPHNLLVSVNNPYDDLIVGFIGDGSQDQEITLDPGESRDITLSIFAQDAMLSEYQLQIDLNSIDSNVNDHAVVNLNVRQPNIDFTITEIGADPYTLTKTLQVSNNGDRITDFTIVAEDGLEDRVLFKPAIIHANVGSGESLTFKLVPLLESDTPITGFINATGAGHYERTAVDFSQSGGKTLFTSILSDVTICMGTNSWYCTNRPNIKNTLSIPPGFDSSDVEGAVLAIDFSLPWSESSYRNHNVDISLNGHLVKSLNGIVPNGLYLIPFDPSFLNYGSGGTGVNQIDITTKHLNGGHYVVATNIEFRLKLNQLTTKLFADSQEEADNVVKNLDILCDKCVPKTEIISVEPSPPQLEAIAGQDVTFDVNVKLKNVQDGALEVDVFKGGSLVEKSFRDVAVSPEITETFTMSFQAPDVAGSHEYKILTRFREGASGELIDDSFCDVRQQSNYRILLTIPDITPSTNKILFQSMRDGNEEIYVMDEDGSNQIRLTQNTASDGYPVWSPDNQKIAFVSNRTGDWEIFSMNTDGNVQTNLTRNPANDGYLSWSPDSQKIVFASDRDSLISDLLDIYVMDADGTNVVRLTNDPAEDVHPAWSPDNQKIAFASDREGNREIYVMNTDGTNVINLTNYSVAYDDYPAWSPDNSKIAFASDRDTHDSEKLDIYLMNADGNNVIRLTSNAFDDRHPAWSSDGSKIAFVSNRDGNREIYVMKADGSEVTRLTNQLSDDQHPSFSPPTSEPTLPTITITSPNGGEEWQTGTTQTIQWSYIGDTWPGVEIEIFNSSGPVQTFTYVPIGSDGSGSYSWVIPENLAYGTGYQVMITIIGSVYSDTSDRIFTISTSTAPQDKSLIQVEGQSEVYWFQNNKLYWVTDWNVINQMSNIPGWNSVKTLPVSEFNPVDYDQGPRFITTDTISDGLLIREQALPEVYLISDGDKHYFTSPESLEWNGYSFDDVIDVSSTIIGMFPSVSDITISQAIIDKYNEPDVSTFLGASEGKGEKEAGQSPHGTTGTYVEFANGHIHWISNNLDDNIDNPNRGKAFFTYGDLDWKYTFLGGTNDWLGFPVMDEVKRDEYGHGYSEFEGGYIDWNANRGEHFDVYYDSYNKPDLIVTDISFSEDNPTEGEPIIVTAKIKNIGPVDTQGELIVYFWQVSHYDKFEQIDNNPYTSVNGSKAIIDSSIITGLYSGEEKETEITWNVGSAYNPNFPDMTRVKVSVDELQQKIDEIDENNNEKFEELKVTSSSNFKPETDGYHFGNYGWTREDQIKMWEHFNSEYDQTPIPKVIKPYVSKVKFYAYAWIMTYMNSGGNCYGMSSSSILYYQNLVSKPINDNTFEMLISNTDVRNSIYYYQETPLILYTLEEALRAFIQDWIPSKIPLPPLYDIEFEYGEIEYRIKNDGPVLINILLLDVEDGKNAYHAVVAFDTYDVSPKIKNVLVYDPNYPGMARIMQFDLENNKINYNAVHNGKIINGKYQSYRNAGYFISDIEKEFRIIMQWYINELIKNLDELKSNLYIFDCPINISITDQYGRIIDNKGNNEIPGAEVNVVGDSKIFLHPADLDYTINIDTFDSGEFTFTQINPLTSEYASLISFIEVPITENTKAISEVSSTNPEYKIEIDYDGDGTIDEIIMPDIIDIVGADFFNITFLPPITTMEQYNLKDGSNLPIKFTARNSITDEFIYDNTINVTITNSTGHLITYFTNGTDTDSVRIYSEEEHYLANLNTVDFPELTIGETYTIQVSFGDVDSLRGYAIAHFTLINGTPPAAITNLHPTSGTTWINWIWLNPSDPDFNHTEIYLNGVFQTNTSAEFFNATGLIPNREYKISTRTMDNLGNINETWVNDTAMTLDTPPVSNASGPYTGLEGQAIIFNASASYDPDPGDNIVSFEWDFNNDGATDATGMEVSWTWNDDHTGQVNLTVTDSHGESSTDATSVTILNAPPEVEAGNDQTVNEGDTVSFSGSFTDPGTGDTHTLEWDFGDGTSDSTDTLEPTHVYADNGTYTVTLTVADDDGALTQDTLNVAVENIAPIVDAGNDQTANEGDIVSFTGSFKDPGTADTHLIEWDFGDGTPVSSGTLTPTHTYADDGTYAVTLTVTDDDGSSTSDALIGTVNNVAPVLDECDDQTVQWGDTMTLSRSFTDPGDDSWTAEIDWGDGNHEEGILSSKTITATHVYSIPGEYICKLTVQDDDGGVGLGDTQITVTTRATELEYIGDLPVQYSDYLNLKAQLNDPGNNNPLPNKSINFMLGTQTATAATGPDGIATVNLKLDQLAGIYDVTAEFDGDESYSPDNDTKAMQILREDAKITYTGDTVLPTTAGSIDLRATLEETDTDYGDLTKTNVDFNIYKSSDLSYSNPIVTIPSVASISVTSSGMGVGTAAATIDNLPEDDYMVIARIVPNDFYLPISSNPTPMIVYEPTGQFTTGGGWIWDPTGSHGNFGFNVKYNKKGKVQGNSIYVYRLDELDYIVKSNAWIGLAISETTSTFQGKAVLQIFDPVTGELQPESSGNFQLIVEAVDNEFNSNPDYYKITVLDKDGLEYHNATGSLEGGNIVIHDKK